LLGALTAVVMLLEGFIIQGLFYLQTRSFWGLYPHVCIREGFIANKPSIGLAYPQIKPFVGGFNCKQEVVMLLEGFIIQGLFYLQNRSC
jgi:hypothetical protein